VSACLLGERVRWDGGDKRDAFVVDVLGRRVRFVPVCPEVEIGMGVPRPPVRLVRGAGAPRMVDAASGKDWTEVMTLHVERRVKALARAGLDGFVLKSGSPSCGHADVRVHGARRPDSGLFAAALAKYLPDLPVEDEQRLRDPRVRATFLARLVAHQQQRGGDRARRRRT
jgi:uncharacterized protein YbbK (DUF523 family)